MKAIEYTSPTYLHCDNEECGKNTDIPEGKTLKDCIGIPCPYCGSNLLTQGDYDHTESILAQIELLNGILPPPEEGDKMVEMRYNHHNGRTSIQITDSPSEGKEEGADT